MVIEDTTISHNFTNGEKGGGLHIFTYDYSDFYITRTNIYANAVDRVSLYEDALGGGISVESYALEDAYAGIEFRMENTTVSDNIVRNYNGKGVGDGGGMYIFGGGCSTQLSQNKSPYAQNARHQQKEQKEQHLGQSVLKRARQLLGLEPGKVCEGQWCRQEHGDVAGANTVVPPAFGPDPGDCGTIVEMYNVTIANNNDDNVSLNGDTLVNVKDSIIANHRGGGDCNNGTVYIDGEYMVSLGNNTISDDSCELYYEESLTGITASNSADMTSEDPALEPLRDNGGLSFTHALTATSSAIDTADADGCSVTGTPAGITDQRGDGYDRYRDPSDPTEDSPRCDRGAYEFAAEPTEAPTATPTPTSGPTPTFTPTPTNTSTPTPVPSSMNTPTPTTVPSLTNIVPTQTQAPTPSLPQPSSPDNPPTNTPTPRSPTASPQEPDPPQKLTNTGIPLLVTSVGGLYFILSTIVIRYLFREE
jgi:hypothetical protein